MATTKRVILRPFRDVPQCALCMRAGGRHKLPDTNVEEQQENLTTAEDINISASEDEMDNSDANPDFNLSGSDIVSESEEEGNQSHTTDIIPFISIQPIQVMDRGRGITKDSEPHGNDISASEDEMDNRDADPDFNLSGSDIGSGSEEEGNQSHTSDIIPITPTKPIHGMELTTKDPSTENESVDNLTNVSENPENDPGNKVTMNIDDSDSEEEENSVPQENAGEETEKDGDSFRDEVEMDLESRIDGQQKKIETSRKKSNEKVKWTEEEIMAIKRQMGKNYRLRNLICLKNHQDDPIAKANVVSFPCTDAYIKDQPDLDVKEWVSVMIESKGRNSKIDFIPLRNSTKEWKDVGRNSFLSWPIHMTDSLAVYEEFTKTMAKEKKKQRGVIRPFQPQPPMPEAVEPQPPMPEAVEPQPPMPEAVEPQPPMPEAVEPQPPMPEAVEPQPPMPEAVEPQPPMPEAVEPQPPMPEAVEPQPPMPEAVKPQPPMPETVEPQPHMPKAVEPQPPMPEAVEPQPPINEEVQPSEVNDDQQDEEEHTACPKPQLDDYVEVAFPVSGKKKQTQLFFGQIVNLDPLTVKFLRKTDKTGFFVWPRREDVSEVEEKEIMRVLPLPTLEGRGKELLVFKC
ncbi:protein app1-like [Mizuhopecten yessoensis]|uniref:protein app1-like n=1 Tax=Mizuhopecten yessoensis TaxID=6573 RepID=UPI000B45989D|nr:protein app1-like [Mizuhopecten yessoensis]